MTYGLIGYPITHSFSQPYFTDKFAKMGLADTHQYLNFPIEDFQGFDNLKAKYPRSQRPERHHPAQAKRSPLP